MGIQFSIVMCSYIGSNFMPIRLNDKDSNIFLVLICVHREMVAINVIGST